jgi:hypothetical protein
MKIWDLLSIDEATREVFKDENYGLREENVKKVNIYKFDPNCASD